MERSYVMIKHDGVQRSLIGEIVARFERAGLKIVGMKMFVPTREQALAFYGKDDAWCERKGRDNVIPAREAKGMPIEKSAIEYGRDIVEQLVKYLTAGPAIAIACEGNQAAGVVKKLVGDTQPLSSDVGTIRGDYTNESYSLANSTDRAVRNLIHCTDPADGPERAQWEIDLFFQSPEIMKYTHINEIILHDVNLDGVWE